MCVSIFLSGNPVFNTDQINIDVSLLQADNFVQYPEQHSLQHTINEKGQTVRGQMKV